MAKIKTGGSVTGFQNVNSSFAALTALSQTITESGYARQADKYGHEAIVSAEGRLNVGTDTPLFYESVDSGGATANPNNWTYSQLNLAHAIVDGFIVMNSAAATTINSYTILTSKRRFQTMAEFSLKHTMGFKTPNVPQANATMEFGFGFVATTAAPTLSGAYLRYATDGTVKAVARWTTTESTVNLASIPAINAVHMLEVKLNRRDVEFYLNGLLVATIGASGNAIPMVPTRMPVFWRIYTGATVPALAPQLFICLDYVALGDANIVRPWNTYNASNGRGLVQNSFSPFTQLAQWPNATQPATITPINTAAVGTYTTPGGLFVINAPGVGTTDLILFAYQVPDGQQALVSGIVISMIVTGGAVATTASAFEWGLSVNSSAASMATADLAGSTSAPKRIGLGVRSFQLAAAIGATVADIQINFPVEMACESGHFIHIFFKPILGTATAGATFSGSATLIGAQE